MRRSIAVFILLLLIDVALITTGRKVNTITRLPQDISSSLITLFNQIRHQGGKTISSIVEANRALEENQRLKGEVLRLRRELRSLSFLRTENLKLKTLLGIKRHTRTITIPARVIGWTGEYWEFRFILNKGEIDGVRKGMAVVGTGGIVGLVKEVFKDHCIAISNVDPEFSIHVEDYRSKVRGVARGDGKNLILDYILPSMDIKVGDILVSTGIGGVFPPGLYVGRVISVQRSVEEKFLKIKALPTDRLENNRFVLIMGEYPFGKKKS